MDSPKIVLLKGSDPSQWALFLGKQETEHLVQAVMGSGHFLCILQMDMIDRWWLDVAPWQASWLGE